MEEIYNKRKYMGTKGKFEGFSKKV